MTEEVDVPVYPPSVASIDQTAIQAQDMIPLTFFTDGDYAN